MSRISKNIFSQMSDKQKITLTHKNYKILISVRDDIYEIFFLRNNLLFKKAVFLRGYENEMADLINKTFKEK